MRVHSSETSVPRDISSIYSTYNKDSQLEKTLAVKPESNSLNTPDDDAAAATIQHSLSGKIANIQQTLQETDVALSSVRTSMAKLSKLEEQLHQISEDITGNGHTEAEIAEIQKELGTVTAEVGNIRGSIESNGNTIINSNDKNVPTLIEDRTDVAKATFATDLGVLKKLKETIEKLISSDNEKNMFKEKSELLKKIGEMIERINSSDWSLSGIRELIDKFSTTNQFDLQAIHGVEQNIKEKNMNLEIGEFSLVRTMEKAREELYVQANVDPKTDTDLQDLPEKQEDDEEERVIQAPAEGLVGNTNNTPDSTDSDYNNLVNIEA